MAVAASGANSPPAMRRTAAAAAECTMVTRVDCRYSRKASHSSASSAAPACVALTAPA